jgi:hypothetical protein
METSPPPHPTIDLSTPLYYQLIYTLTALLPPPLDDTQDALRARNHAAIAKIASLLPVNANEADLAAQCIAARAQAEDLLRLIRQNADDIQLTMRLNAQYTSMVRTSLSTHARLMRVQAVRQKRESIEGAANQDAWTQHIAERSMLTVLDPNPGSQTLTFPERAPTAFPEPPPSPYSEPIHPAWFEPLPSAHENQENQHQVPHDETNSQTEAFETWMDTLPWNQRSQGSGPPALRETIRKAMAEPPPSGPESPATGHETPGQANQPDQHDPTQRTFASNRYGEAPAVSGSSDNRCSSGGNARLPQSGRSHSRQDSPILTLARSRSSPSA